MNKEFYGFICETLDNVIDTKVSYDNQTDLTSYGINSLSYIKILVAIEDKYGIEFEDEYLSLEKMNTIDSIFSVVQKYVDELK